MPHPDVFERIKRRAYSLWEEEGRPEGRAAEHWFRAEAEVVGIDTGEEAGPGTPGAGVHVCPACAGTGRRGRGRCRRCGGTGRIVDARTKAWPHPNELNRSSPMADKPERTKPVAQQQGEDLMAAGDEAPAGTPGTGEDVCPACGGSGHVDGQECEKCLGMGRLIKATSAGS